jgi:hypothetical protein
MKTKSVIFVLQTGDHPDAYTGSWPGPGLKMVHPRWELRIFIPLL